MDKLSDTELMALVKEGDYRAFDVLYHRYRGLVLRFLFALTWDAQAAEDGLQEVFGGLFKSRADYIPSAKLSTYLFQIARNHYLAQRRKRRHVQAVSLSCTAPDGTDPFAGIRANERVEPEVRLMQAYRRRRIRQAIQALSESRQLVFVMAHFEEMKYADNAPAKRAVDRDQSHRSRQNDHALRDASGDQLPEYQGHDHRNFTALGIATADTEGRTMVRGTGCDACRKTGYRGRTSLFEVLTINKEMSSLIGQGAEIPAIAEAARATGHRALREDGRQKVTDGITTPEEVLRVLG